MPLEVSENASFAALLYNERLEVTTSTLVMKIGLNANGLMWFVNNNLIYDYCTASFDLLSNDASYYRS